MNNIVDVLKNALDFIGGTGRTGEEIENAEKQLGVRFAHEFRCYLKEIGLASFDGHELTGLCKTTRLNVVDVTLTQRDYFPEAYSWYVIEEANIDGIVIWQSSAGDIFQTEPGRKAEKIYSSLAEYVKGTV